jgi:hypothetical protein
MATLDDARPTEVVAAGDRIGDWVAIEYYRTGTLGRQIWKWRCTGCGHKKRASALYLRRHPGCVHCDPSSRKPRGWSRVPNFNTAKARCTNPRNGQYKDYGARGIEFRFKDERELLEELGPRPGPGYVMDRIDNDGHYEKGNVRWTDYGTSNRNKRKRPKLKVYVRKYPGLTPSEVNRINAGKRGKQHPKPSRVREYPGLTRSEVSRLALSRMSDEARARVILGARKGGKAQRARTRPAVE